MPVLPKQKNAEKQLDSDQKSVGLTTKDTEHTKGDRAGLTTDSTDGHGSDQKGILTTNGH